MIRPAIQILNEEAIFYKQEISSLEDRIKALEEERTNELLRLETITDDEACALHNVDNKEEARIFINESINYEIEFLYSKLNGYEDV